jgi:hypothetical protein
MLQLLVLALTGSALWKLHHDFNDDAIFLSPGILSDGRVKQALGTAKVVAKTFGPNENLWPRFEERRAAYQTEADKRGL